MENIEHFKLKSENEDNGNIINKDGIETEDIIQLIMEKDEALTTYNGHRIKKSENLIKWQTSFEENDDVRMTN